MSDPTPTSPPDKDKSQPQPPSAVEFEPPLACVRRILKNTLPSSTNVGKDASAAFARACGIFIIYLTACSNDFAREHKRQTITANDVLAAIKVSTGREEGGPHCPHLSTVDALILSFYTVRSRIYSQYLHNFCAY
jgi:histone H3/H4